MSGSFIVMDGAPLGSLVQRTYGLSDHLYSGFYISGVDDLFSLGQISFNPTSNRLIVTLLPF